MNSRSKAMNLTVVLNSPGGAVAIFVPALLAGRVIFAPVWMALFDQFDCIGHNVLRFLGSMRPKKLFGNLMLTQTADDFSSWHRFYAVHIDKSGQLTVPYNRSIQQKCGRNCLFVRKLIDFRRIG
jgi:hypothetical protein